MKFFLSSYRFGNQIADLAAMVNEPKTCLICMNALDYSDDIERKKESLKIITKELESYNISSQTLDLREYFDRKNNLAKLINSYQSILVTGGNCFILRKAFAYSGLDQILVEKKADPDFTYAAWSAGVCVITPSLRGIELTDNPNALAKDYKSEIIWDGLGFVDYCIAPHYRSDHPESADIEKTVQYWIDNKILFKALHDGEVILKKDL